MVIGGGAIILIVPAVIVRARDLPLAGRGHLRDLINRRAMVSHPRPPGDRVSGGVTARVRRARLAGSHGDPEADRPCEVIGWRAVGAGTAGPGAGPGLGLDSQGLMFSPCLPMLC